MTLRRQAIRIAAAVAVVASTSLGLGVEAARGNVPKSYDLQSLQAIGQRAAYHRINLLYLLTLEANGAHALTAAQHQTLVSQLQRDADGIQNFWTKLKAETEPTAARADVMALHAQYLVGRLQVPKVAEIAQASVLSSNAARYTVLAGVLANIVASAKANGTDTTKAERFLADMQTAVSNAKNLVGPIPAQLIPLEPAGYPGNAAVLAAAGQAIVQARRDLTQALNDTTGALESLA